MTLPISYMTIAAAAVPVFVFLMLLIFHWGIPEAAPMAALVTVFLSFGIFRASALMIAAEGCKGIWNAMPAVLLLFAAALLYRILRQRRIAAGKESGYQAEYHRKDVWKQIRAEREEDLESIDAKEALVPYALMLVLAAGAFLLRKSMPLSAPRFHFDFPETATGYGFTNPACQAYGPLSPLAEAALVLLAADCIGLVILQAKGMLKQGGLLRTLRKALEMTLPAGIAVCGLFLMLALMNGCGQIYVFSTGLAERVSFVPAGAAAIVLAPPILYLYDRKRAERLKNELESQKEQMKKKSGKGGTDPQPRSRRFYETREGSFSIAFAVIVFSLFLMLAGLWGSDQTLTLDGFAAILTAMLYCPMRTFIFEKAKMIL